MSKLKKKLKFSKLHGMMTDLASQMTTVKHEQEYMEVRERIHT